MKIHKEGYKIILVSFLILAVLDSIFYFLFKDFEYLFIDLSILLGVFYILIVSFFRSPKREIIINNNYILAPADGKVVVIEETDENEYLKEKRIQVSIFMSPLNVHVNWYSISGVVKYFKHHHGKFLVAWHPKSSTENERTTVVVETENKVEILFRQIAGAVARRIVCYSMVGDKVAQGEQFGFIKFGSRVDVFLPLGTKINVKPNQKVVGNKTVIAELN